MKALLASLALTTPTFAEDAMPTTPDWRFEADTVMGGVSTGRIARETVAGREATRLTGDVSLENDGGFVQMNFDVTDDVSGASGIAFDVYGNGETYELRARTDDLDRPWQSFRASFTAPAAWTTVEIAFDDLEPHRTDATFDKARLKRIGIVAIGRAFAVDVAVSEVRFLP